MKYPKQIQIGGHTYSVEIVDQHCLDTFANIGGHHYQGLRIELSSRAIDGKPLPLTVINTLFWHELVHAIARGFSISLEEEDVERMSQGITQVLSQLGIYLVEVDY